LVQADRVELYAELVRVDDARLVMATESLLLGASESARAIEALAAPAGCIFPTEQSYDGAYATEYRVDVPSDGRFHAIPVTQRFTPTRKRYTSVPRESQQVYRQLEFENPFSLALLEGPVDVYVEGRYLMSTTLHATPKQGKAKLGLGVEPRIKIARNTSYAEETAGLLRGQLELVHTVELEIENHLPTEISIEVRERIPVTQEKEEDVRVTLVAVEPPWHDYDQEEQPLQGGHAFVVALEPGKKQRLGYRYAVRIPAKQELVGGNRREN
jgi:uncharacterized protein (TIGR02231 family)